MNRRAQEEMIGFVLIMLVVAVIFLVFLAFYVRHATNSEPSESLEISQFLESAFEYTTDCGPTAYPERLSRVIILCYEGKTCPITGQDSCDLLRETLRGMVESSWNFNENSPQKGYVLNIMRETGDRGTIAVLNYNETHSSDPPSISGGDISGGAKRAAEKPLPYGITLRLEIYS